MEKNLTTIYLVRHGETEWNVKKLVQGHQDSPLTAEGIQQGKILGEKLKKVDFEAVFSSDSLRAHKTAQLILLEKKIAIKTTESLRERKFGQKYEGKHSEILNTDIRNYLAKYQHMTNAQRLKIRFTPDMESNEEVLSRVITFLREIAVGFKGKKVLVVTHGGVMRHLLIHLGFGDHNSLSYGAINNNAMVILQCDGIDFFVKETSGINRIMNKE